jgi:hypothetical protein
MRNHSDPLTTIHHNLIPINCFVISLIFPKMMMFDYPAASCNDQQFFTANNYDEILDILDFSFGKS